MLFKEIIMFMNKDFFNIKFLLVNFIWNEDNLNQWWYSNAEIGPQKNCLHFLSDKKFINLYYIHMLHICMYILSIFCFSLFVLKQSNF